MVYRYLGNSGLKVSVIGFGNWVTGHDPEAEKVQIEVIKKCWEHGVNFFDTAEIYGFGEAERILGKAIKALNADRADLVITTKLFYGGPEVNNKGNSRKHLIEGIRRSLKNLQLDYVDVVFSHRPDYETPLEEICKGFSDLISQGYAFYWGTSEWRPDMITRAIEICRRHSWHEPICEQPQYSMMWRQRFEKEYEYIFRTYKYGTTVWSPLCQGLLTGKFNEGTIPEDSRWNTNPYTKMVKDMYLGEKTVGNTVRILKGLEAIAKELGFSQAQLALAWVLANKDVSVAIIGASKVSQAEDNLKAVELLKKWDKTLEKKLNELLGNEPDVELDFKNGWVKSVPRRQIALDVKSD